MAQGSRKEENERETGSVGGAIIDGHSLRSSARPHCGGARARDVFCPPGNREPRRPHIARIYTYVYGWVCVCIGIYTDA